MWAVGADARYTRAQPKRVTAKPIVSMVASCASLFTDGPIYGRTMFGAITAVRFVYANPFSRSFTSARIFVSGPYRRLLLSSLGGIHL